MITFIHKLPSKKLLRVLPFIICILFLAAYGTLSVVKHIHYQTGYDLSINDQLVWRYSTFQIPLTTTAPYPDKIKLYSHVEIVYVLLAPLYWIWSNPIMLLLAEVTAICAGSIAIFTLARKRKLSYSVSLTLLIGYLGFYGVQFAVWNDVHSASFATSFLAWFLYFFDQRKTKATVLLFLLAITAKENIAFLTLFISAVYLIKRRDIMTISFVIASIMYLGFIFYIYFPHIIQFQYPYQNQAGLLSNVDLRSMINSEEKLKTMLYTFSSFGFLPILSPLHLIPSFADFATYFMLGSDLPGAQGIFGHYRITLAPLMAWATIITISKYKLLNNKYTALYLLLCTAIMQYALHLPLSYLTKAWFWQESQAVKSIMKVNDAFLPKDASVVAQVNILPHLTHRDKIYTLYPEKKQFTLANSPCGKTECNWFHWHDNPEFLFIDTSPDWDARHLLANREEFMDGITNLEKAKIIVLYKREGTTTLYKVQRNPFNYWIYPLIVD